MTLEQLRIFIAVAERQHVTEAARALNLTQSATSAAIAALEERHDVRLFDRVGRGVVLTDLGRSFLPEARAVIARAEDAAGFLAASMGLHHGRLRLVASQTVANYWLPRVMQTFHAAHPGIDLTLRILNTYDVGQAVAEGEADLGFVEDEVTSAALTLTPAATDQLVIVAAAPVADLAQTPWVMREQGSGTRAILEQALTAAGITPRIALELPSNEAVRAAVEAGAGVTALSRVVVEASLAAGRLTEIAFPIPPRQFHAVRPTGRHVSRAAQAFLECALG
ncbi:LysR family transcriptional regulator [Paracoccus subflavus]|jgi:DNA-binding transcriptional LysR family regulator|uniref:LysR family transcriptional regulator n=1 Tax=Paracoccus subflavus TaxID=2528244 RepID=A0A4Q9FXA0_9RHOB|nr:LysR family transcriptional regulator [Paracoccus subflavus]TBN38608.1 LysR family transcriptional regulator [Paracoccus subflavus]